MKILINWNMQLAQLYPELTVIGIPVRLIHGLWNVKSINSEKWVKFKIAILQKLQTVKCQTDSCELSVLHVCVYMHYNHKKLCFILVLYICTIIVFFKISYDWRFYTVILIVHVSMCPWTFWTTLVLHVYTCTTKDYRNSCIQTFNQKTKKCLLTCLSSCIICDFKTVTLLSSNFSWEFSAISCL